MAAKDLTLTEQRNPHTEDIDAKSSLEIVGIIGREDERVAEAVRGAREEIATAIDWAAKSFQNGGRLIYAGAGTSGRLGTLDAAECPPTFGVPTSWVEALIAGGKKALTRAVEGAEDDPEAGAKDLAAKKPSKNDVVIGISSGSTTSYVRGALEEARRAGAKTVFLTCTPVEDGEKFADQVIAVLTGPEALTGSTRMKAGSATKMVLNMISTGAMIRTGRTYGNLMVDLSCSNRKLTARGLRIIRSVTQVSEKRARALLKDSGGNVKTALAMEICGVPKEAAEKQLKDNGGFLRRLFNRPHRKNPKIAAVFFDMDGTIVHYALPVHGGFSTWAAICWSYGIYQEMEELVADFRAGKIKEEEIWEACAQRLKGQPFLKTRDILFPCAGAPPYSRGFTDCTQSLQGHYKLGIVSSGISIVSKEIREKLKLDFEVSNHLGTADGQFDGTCVLRVPFHRKLDAVRAQAETMGLQLSQICFVGDSPNDIETLKAVGLPVAYNPKTEEVTKAAKGNVIGDFLQLPQLIERHR